MADLPQIASSHRQPFSIKVLPYWKDHHFQGRPVLSAVEAMQLLAAQVQKVRPGIPATGMIDARFAKFLEIDPASDSLDTFCDLTVFDDGRIRAALITKARAKTSAITRSIEHASIDFPLAVESEKKLPLDIAASVEDVCLSVSPDRIYAELVPFGAHYRTICRPLLLSEDGALALVRAPERPAGPADPLGSPFPMDGAFHAACVWGQRYAKVVAFPVGIENRTVLKATVAGEIYTARIIPVRCTAELLIFDIWILDHHGAIYEAALGVQMRDVSKGRWLPPAWVMAANGGGLGQCLARHCEGAVVIERTALAPFAHRALSDRELARMDTMGHKRRQGYLCARLAGKRLWRRLSGDDHITAGASITTIIPGRPYPCLPATHDQRTYHCSMSHDDRFAVAVAGCLPIGVDVEKITPRAFQVRRLFMHPSEQALIHNSTVDEDEAAIRIWSVKEAAAKVWDLSLAAAWQQIEVVYFGKNESRAKRDGGPELLAIHEKTDGHVFTLVQGYGSF